MKLKSVRARIGLFMVFFAVISGGSVAAASSLHLVSAPRPMFAAAAKCSAEQVEVGIEGASANFSLPEGCLNLPIGVHVVGASGTLEAFTTGQEDNTVVLPATPEETEGVLLTADSWVLRTSWYATEKPPVDDSIFTCTVPQGTCRVEITSINKWSESSWPTIDTYQVKAEVLSDSLTAQPWQVTINLSSPQLPFLAQGLQDVQYGGLVKVGSTDCSATPRTVTIKGTDTWGQYHLVGAGLPSRNIQIEGRLTKTGNLLSCG